MEETVVAKWSKDINAMQKEATQRRKRNASKIESDLNALRHAFKAFETRFKRETDNLEQDTRALEKAFEEFASEFNKYVGASKERAELLSSKIWGTQADKEAWQKGFR